MVVIVPAPPDLQSSSLSLFTVTDDQLGKSPILIFYGPSATAFSSGSRIQAHIFSPGGAQSYPRLAVSPSSPLYAAVTQLPRDEQGDEICRGLAFSLYKYFGELSDAVKTAWKSTTAPKARSSDLFFTQQHAAELASRMVKVLNINVISEDITRIFGEQSTSWLDLDLVLPSNAFQASAALRLSTSDVEESEDERTRRLYGKYASIVSALGLPTFLPTSSLRRAPSRITGLGRTKSFSRRQKENIRREMCELLDTEENYVGKVYDLVTTIATEFRQCAKAKDLRSSGPDHVALKRLFPLSLDEILEANTAFLEDIRKVVEDTENDAIKDIEVTVDDDAATEAAFVNGPSDVTGALALANCFLSWLPKFQKSYSTYIKAHAGFSQFFKAYLKDTGSTFSKKVDDVGEQHLTSMLIEPVQRLPRYNLYIDNMLKHLPIRHTAVKPLLRVRDIISDICSEDGNASKQVNAIEYLRYCVGNWPLEFTSESRLTCAIEVDHLKPPFSPHGLSTEMVSAILLVFTDFVILLHRMKPNAVSARSLLAKLESNDSTHSTNLGSDFDSGLQFFKALDVSDINLTEMDDESAIRITSQSYEGHMETYHFFLRGSYEGRASSVTKELIRARIEGRFLEEERESDKWECRAINGDLGFITAIYEDHRVVSKVQNHIPPSVCLLVDLPNLTPTGSSSQELGQTKASLKTLPNSQYLLEIDGQSGSHWQDRISEADLLPVLRKRLTLSLQSAFSIHNPSYTHQLVLQNLQMLTSLNIEVEPDEPITPQERNIGPSSPVKLLSSLFGGAISSIPKKTIGGTTSFMNSTYRISAPTSPVKQPRPESTLSRNESIKIKEDTEDGRYDGKFSIANLEQTLATFVLALHSRKGNVVGKVLRSRKFADHNAVNELHDGLLSRPDDHTTPAQASVDILFAAFERFLNGAWEKVMGPIVSIGDLAAIQEKSEQLTPMEFVEFFRNTVANMAPQNQRAFRKLMKLLTDLLDGAGNDGDRGILTASFAEVLVPGRKDALNYMSLLDRLVDDRQLLFADDARSGTATPNNDSTLFEGRSRTGNLGSISSNTSSLRRRLGLGTLTRENSRNDGENKSPSVWRTLSKSARGVEHQNGSPSKASLSRAKSIEQDLRPSPKRPISRDKPNGLGSFKFESPSHDGKLFPGNKSPGAAAGESEVSRAAGPPRKKRRSSLSDLTTLASGNNTPSWSPLTPRNQHSVQSVKNHINNLENSPRTPSPTKQSNIPSLKSTPNNRKEDSPLQSSVRRQGATTSRPSSMRSDECKVPALNIHKRANGLSGIPSLKPPSAGTNVVGALSERPTGGNSSKPPPEKHSTGTNPTSMTGAATTTTGGTPSPQKQRMQSPQKLRRRLQNEQKVVGSVEASLQAELSKIEDEMSSSLHHRASRNVLKPLASATDQHHAPGSTVNGTANGTTNGTANGTSNGTHSNSHSPGKVNPALSSLPQSASTAQTRLKTVEARTTSQINDVKKTLATLALDLSSSLEVSEERARRLDELYKAAVAENEALSVKYNEELRKVLDVAVGGGGGGGGGERGKKGPEELVALVGRKIRDVGDEAVAAKKEVARLRRENAGLRALVRKE